MIYGCVIFVKNVIPFCCRMESMNELRKSLKLNLNLTENKKCEYCDWKPDCCEWCGKMKHTNKPKLETVEIYKKKERHNLKNILYSYL